MSTFVAAITFSSNASLIWLAAPILFSNRLNPQSEINFGDDGSEDGYTRWLLGRRVATEILARKMGLPLGHEVEVRLVGGMRLRGKLRLQEETMFIDEDRVRRLGLRVNKVVFTYRELESCARLEEVGFRTSSLGWCCSLAPPISDYQFVLLSTPSRWFRVRH